MEATFGLGNQLKMTKGTKKLQVWADHHVRGGSGEKKSGTRNLGGKKRRRGKEGGGMR